MKIFYSLEVFTPHISGVTVSTDRLASYFSSLKDYETYIITASDSGDFLIEKTKKGYSLIKIRSYPSPIGKDTKVSYFAKLNAKKIIDQFQPDLIHLQDPLFISLSLASEAKKRQIPVIMTQHNSLEFPLSYLGFPKFFKNWSTSIVKSYYQTIFHKYCDLIIAPSHFIEEEIKKISPDIPTQVISNGIDLKRIEGVKITEDFLEKYQFKDIVNKPIVLYVGRISQEKNLKTLLKSIPLILKNQEATFLFVGEGKLKEEMIKELEKLSLLERIRFCSVKEPNSDEIYCFYKLATLFVMPSLIEAQSLATMEAMACGLPIVASNKGALPELVKDEENGFLVDGLNPEEMATAVLKIINDSNLQRKFSLKSKEIIASHDINQVYPLLKNIYEESFKNSFKKNRVEEENL